MLEVVERLKLFLSYLFFSSYHSINNENIYEGDLILRVTKYTWALVIAYDLGFQNC